ncbi:hypothetical protein QT990_20165 [Microcoleus sp. T3_B1]
MGYWLLVIGYWLLVIGYWLLVIGYWLLEAEPPGMYSQAEPGNKTKTKIPTNKTKIPTNNK